MSPTSGIGTSLSVILLPPHEADAPRLAAERFVRPEFSRPVELLHCLVDPSGASFLAEAKNQHWRAARGEWVLFMIESAEIPPLDSIAAATESDFICSQDGLALPDEPSLSPPFAIRRSLLEELNGFSDLPDGVEDFELGLRLREARARILHPAGWAQPTSFRVGAIAFETVLALFYRHPFHWVLKWACDQIEPGVANLDENLSARFSRIFGHPVPASGRHSAEELGHYFAEWSDPPLQSPEVITRALEGAEAAGLYASGTAEEQRFDRSHAANWLMANTTYFEAMAERNLVLRIPPPRLADGPAAPHLAILIEGRYEVEVSAGIADGLRNPVLSLPLPVACDEQRDLQLFGFEPPEFEQFVDEAQSAVNLPVAPPRGQALRIGYSFRCRVQEGTCGSEGFERPGRQAKVNARYAATIDRMLASVFRDATPPKDLWQRAWEIYAWILDNISSRWSDRAGLFALEARAGNCAQRVRLFTLLCDRVGLVVRERCGILAGLLHQEGNLEGQRWASTARSDRGHTLSHVWAEVYLGDTGWSPVDFMGADSGRRMMTPGNVRDAALRQRLKDWTRRLDSYYFGHVDPYRIYFGTAPKLLSGIPDGITGNDFDSIWRVAWGTRHTLRMRLHGLPPGPGEVGG